jgi:hypothetical protein
MMKKKGEAKKQKIILETDAYLLSVEDSFTEIISLIPVPQKTIFTDSLLTQFISSHQVVEGIFYLSGMGLPHLLNNNLLYVPDDFSSVSYVERSPTIQDMLEKGWQIEFRENNYIKALKYYRNVLPNFTHAQSRGEILSAYCPNSEKAQTG